MGRESWRRIHRSMASAPRWSTRDGRRTETACAEDIERARTVPTKRMRGASFRTREVAEPALQGTVNTTPSQLTEAAPQTSDSESDSAASRDNRSATTRSDWP